MVETSNGQGVTLTSQGRGSEDSYMIAVQYLLQDIAFSAREKASSWDIYSFLTHRRDVIGAWYWRVCQERGSCASTKVSKLVRSPVLRCHRKLPENVYQIISSHSCHGILEQDF
jgi:hypothetical protein